VVRFNSIKKTMMDKNRIINILYALAISMMLYGIYVQLNTEKGQINIFFWLGLMFYAIGALMKQSEKKKPE